MVHRCGRRMRRNNVLQGHQDVVTQEQHDEQQTKP